MDPQKRRICRESAPMAYVNVPKDLSKVKNKVAFNLTKRQLICLIPTVLIGMALYYSARQVMSVSNAATLMVLGMLPGFLLALYEKDGMYLEQVLGHRIRVRYLRPHNRPYRTDTSHINGASPLERRRRK